MKLRSKVALAGAGMLLVGALAAARRAPSRPTPPPAEVAAVCDGASGACERPTRDGAAKADVALPTGKPRMLEFESAHCAACERMAPLVKDIEQRCTRDADTIVRMSVDHEEGEALAERYGVRALPTFVNVDANGEEVERAVGEQPKQRIADMLSEVHGARCAAAL